MKKIVIIFAIIIIAGVLFIKKYSYAPVLSQVPQDVFKNASFEIDGKLVQLEDGVAETEIYPGSASKLVTRYFGNVATGDLNFDGVDDTAFLVTQEGGGSGIFYYVVVNYSIADGHKTTNAFLIGDRIAPQSTNIIANELHVNFAERYPGEPMTAQPSVGATLLLKVTPEGVLEGLMK